MVDQREIIEKKIVETEKKLEKVIQDNRRKELTKLMFDIIAGRSSLPNLGMGDLIIFEQLVDQKLSEIQKGIESRSGNNLNQVVQATNNVVTMTKGAGEN